MWWRKKSHESLRFFSLHHSEQDLFVPFSNLVLCIYSAGCLVCTTRNMNIGVLKYPPQKWRTQNERCFGRISNARYERFLIHCQKLETKKIVPKYDFDRSMQNNTIWNGKTKSNAARHSWWETWNETHFRLLSYHIWRCVLCNWQNIMILCHCHVVGYNLLSNGECFNVIGWDVKRPNRLCERYSKWQW